GNLLQVSIGRDGSLHPHVHDLADPTARYRMLEQRWNFFGPTVAGYRLSTYRRLPQGWAPAPEDIWCDLHMWRKFLRLEHITVGTRYSIQAIALENAGRQGMNLEERRAETERWFRTATTPHLRADYVASCWARTEKLLSSLRRDRNIDEVNAQDLKTRVATLELNTAALAAAFSELDPLPGKRQKLSPTPIFVERAYLEANPDVSDAVQSGDLRSGLEHWLSRGRKEGRRLQ